VSFCRALSVRSVGILFAGIMHDHIFMTQNFAIMLQDTLLFFYGAIMCVGGIAAQGFLDMMSRVAYEAAGITTTNTLIGCLSAVVDNM